MKRVKHFIAGLGCLVSLIAPVLGVVLFPRAKWLFAFVLVWVTLFVLKFINPKPNITPEELANRAERLLEGTSGGWDVDDYEHLNPKDQRIRELWSRTLAVGGLPEEWMQLDQARKSELREIIRTLRQMGGATA